MIYTHPYIQIQCVENPNTNLECRKPCHKFREQENPTANLEHRKPDRKQSVGNPTANLEGSPDAIKEYVQETLIEI